VCPSERDYLVHEPACADPTPSASDLSGQCGSATLVWGVPTSGHVGQLTVRRSSPAQSRVATVARPNGSDLARPQTNVAEPYRDVARQVRSHPGAHRGGLRSLMCYRKLSGVVGT
jgi:hypothetical protein